MRVVGVDEFRAEGVEFDDDGPSRFLRLETPGCWRAEELWFRPGEREDGSGYQFVTIDPVLAAELEATYQLSKARQAA